MMVLDSGADEHAVCNINWLQNVRELRPTEKFGTADESSIIEATHEGQLTLKVRNCHGVQNYITLERVVYVPKLGKNLISAAKITQNDIINIKIKAKGADAYYPDSNEILFSAYKRGNTLELPCTYMFVEPDEKEYKRLDVLVADGESMEPEYRLDRDIYPFMRNSKELGSLENGRVIETIDLTEEVDQSRVSDQEMVNEQITTKQLDQKTMWHRRTGHLSAKYLNHLQKNSVGIPINLKFKDDDFKDCQPCIEAKILD